MLSLYRNLLVYLIVLFVLGLDYRLRLMCFSWLEKKFIKLSICLRLFSIRRKFLTFRLFYVEKLFCVVRRSFFLGLYDHFIIICELFDKLFAEENLINWKIYCYTKCWLCRTSSSSLVISCLACPLMHCLLLLSFSRLYVANPVPESSISFSTNNGIFTAKL